MPLSEQSLDKRVKDWTLGNDDAALLIKSVWRASRIIDDLVDEEGLDRGPKMVEVVAELILGIGTNPFYLRHQGTFAPFLMLATLTWRAADVWRKQKDRSIRMAGYVHRDTMQLLVPLVALVLGGPAHAESVLHDVIYATSLGNKETFEDWEKE